MSCLWNFISLISVGNWWWVFINSSIKVNWLGVRYILCLDCKSSSFFAFPLYYIFRSKTSCLDFPVSPSSCILVILCFLFFPQTLSFPSRHLGFCYVPICSSIAPSVRDTIARQRKLFVWAYLNICFWFWQMSLTLSIQFLKRITYSELDRCKLQILVSTNSTMGWFIWQ